MKTTTLNIGGTITILSVLIASFAINSDNGLAGSSEFAILATSVATVAALFALVYIDHEYSNRANQLISSRIAARNTAFTGSGVARKSEMPNEESNLRTASRLDAA